uniref:Uncharacterized protein n=1 Tax=Rhizophora mucronata TaxID=61149 RepID=A0A2P2PEE9_RHIMU
MKPCGFSEDKCICFCMGLQWVIMCVTWGTNTFKVMMLSLLFYQSLGR